MALNTKPLCTVTTSRCNTLETLGEVIPIQSKTPFASERFSFGMVCELILANIALALDVQIVAKKCEDLARAVAEAKSSQASKMAMIISVGSSDNDLAMLRSLLLESERLFLDERSWQ